MIKTSSNLLELSTQTLLETSRKLFIYPRVPEYYEYGIPYFPSDAETRHNELASTGAFVAYSGTKTGYIFI